MSLPRERLIEYLYGELPSAEQAAFEAQLAASEDARRELAALRATLRSARESLALSADPPPPSRVRASVLAAAEAQLKRAPLAAAASSQPAAATSRARFGRSVRAAWIVPSLAMAAAAAFLVFSKHAPLDPERAQLRMEPPLEPAAPELPAATTPQPSAADGERSASKGAAQPSATEIGSTPAAAKRERPPTPERARAAKPSSTGARSKQDSFSVPPPGWRGQSTSERDAAPVAAQPPAAAELERAAGAAEGRAASPPAAAQSAPLAAADLERRAREHAVARRWAQAAEDYRELLRRFPRHTRVNMWKQQLALATRALNAVRR